MKAIRRGDRSVIATLAADFRGQIVQRAAKQVESFQREQQGCERGKPANAGIAIQAERLERG